MMALSVCEGNSDVSEGGGEGGAEGVLRNQSARITSTGGGSGFPAMIHFCTEYDTGISYWGWILFWG